MTTVYDWLWIGGERLRAAGGTVDVVSPRSEEIIGRVPLAGPADVDRAVSAARSAFDDGKWRRRTPDERAVVLRRLATLIEEHADELGRLTADENGEPIATSGSIGTRIAFALRKFGDKGARHCFEERRTDEGSESLVLREPVGVVAAIPAWNGPLTLGLQKVAPALMAGCTVVWKVPLENPLSSFLTASFLEEAGVPAGVVNVITADVAESERLVSHPSVDKVSFTGSTAVGKLIGVACARDVRRVTLELGGKSAAIVLDDADLSEAIPRIVAASVAFKQGEACTAQTRILVPRTRHEEIIDLLADRIGRLRVGDPLDPATEIGPLISARHRGRVEAHIAAAREEGARVVVGGGRPAHLDRGWYVEPTLFADVTNDMRIAREEVFGPVATVIPHEGADHAVELANDSPYGLAGTVWTRDLAAAESVARRVRTGTFCINRYGVDPNAPFGGFKQSGVGREMGSEGIDEYLELKSVLLGA